MDVDLQHLGQRLGFDVGHGAQDTRYMLVGCTAMRQLHLSSFFGQVEKITPRGTGR